MILTTYQQIEKYLLNNPGTYKTLSEISRAVNGECVRHAFKRAIKDIALAGRADTGFINGEVQYRINQ